MMYNTMMQSVQEFNTAMDVGRKSQEENRQLYNKLIEEEYEEWLEEAYATNHNPEKELKEMCDMLYVIFGHAINQGYNLIPAFNRVHQSNMTKLDNGKPVYNEDGKIIKGKFYTKPNLSDLV